MGYGKRFRERPCGVTLSKEAFFVGTRCYFGSYDRLSLKALTIESFPMRFLKSADAPLETGQCHYAF